MEGPACRKHHKCHDFGSLSWSVTPQEVKNRLLGVSFLDIVFSHLSQKEGNAILAGDRRWGGRGSYLQHPVG